MSLRSLLGTVALAGLVACGGGDVNAEQTRTSFAGGSGTNPAPAACELLQAGRPLPAEVRESSGLARSLRDTTVFWTHNDAGNAPDLFAIGEDGSLLQRVRVRGASLTDWEDIESGRCTGEPCLYVADIGDNDGDRERITIYRLREPAREASETEPAEAMHARFPRGPADAESLFLHPSGDLFVVTKGRHGAVRLYRLPGPYQAGRTATLEPVRELFPQPEREEDRVTGASTSPDGRWTGIRTYRTLYLYPSAALVGGGPVEPVTMELSALGEPQGEALVVGDDGSVWLTTEAGDDGGRPRWSRLRCALPGG